MLKLYSLLILAVALFLSCVSIGFVDENNIDACGGERYTSVSQICENDTLKNPCGEYYYDPKTQFCAEQDTKIYDKCGGKEYNPFDVNQICEDNVLKTKCGEYYYDPKMQFCNGNRVLDKCDGKDYEPVMYECKDGILFNKCGNEIFDTSIEYCIDGIVRNKKFIDNRDGKTYKYVPIGSQIWMAENLRYEILNAKCYDDNPDNCETYGMLYDWNAAKTICPSGWHLPSDSEWNILHDFVGNNAAKLEANNHLWFSGKGTDAFGFTALPSGYYINDIGGTLEIAIGETALFWSATTSSMTGYAYSFHLSTSGYRNGLGLTILKTNDSWVSVRCIED